MSSSLVFHCRIYRLGAIVYLRHLRLSVGFWESVNCTKVSYSNRFLLDCPAHLMWIYACSNVISRSIVRFRLVINLNQFSAVVSSIPWEEKLRCPVMAIFYFGQPHPIVGLAKLCTLWWRIGTVLCRTSHTLSRRAGSEWVYLHGMAVAYALHQ